MNPPDRASSLDPQNLLAFLKRNLEPGTTFLREDSDAGISFVVAGHSTLAEGADQKWYHLTPEGVMGLASAQALVLESVDLERNQVLMSVQETSFISYGFAAPVRRMKRKRRFPIRESADGIKDAIRGNRSLLKHFISLSDAYKADPQLSSKQAKTAMQAILKSLYDAGSSDVAASYGQVDFEPNQMAWISFFDQIGEQTLGEFLGISDTSEIPGANLDQRADDIRKQAGADEVPETDPAALLASTPPRASNLQERRKRFDAALKPMARYYTQHRR